MRFKAACVSLLTVAASQVLGAQSLVSLGAVSLSANHKLLGRPLLGFSIGLRPATRVQTVAFQFSFAHAGGSASRIGVPCGGMVNPFDSTCVTQPMRDESKLDELAAGLAVGVLRRSTVDMAITADLKLASVRTASRGITSGRVLQGGELLSGFFVGATLSWRPLQRAPVAVEASWSAGGFTRTFPVEAFDAYTPFHDPFGVKQGHLALVWRR